MPYVVMSEEYKKYVVEDLKEFGEIRRPVKAKTVERLSTKALPPTELHPNPGDEFSMPQIGPNYEIVSNYMKLFRTTGVEEPLTIEKIAPDGYMLLNGHHRWLAALKLHLPSVPVKITNLVHAEDVAQMLENAECDKRASFDLDEVLWVREDEVGTVEEEKAEGFFFERKYEKRLRQYVPFMLQELNRMGYDIWVYTAGYYSVDEIEDFFKHYDVHIHGIVNGARRGKKNREIAPKVNAAFSGKYKENIHADAGHVLRISPDTGDYDYITLDETEPNWAIGVLKVVKKFQPSDDSKGSEEAKDNE